MLNQPAPDSFGDARNINKKPYELQVTFECPVHTDRNRAEALDYAKDLRADEDENFDSVRCISNEFGYYAVYAYRKPAPPETIHTVRHAYKQAEHDLKIEKIRMDGWVADFQEEPTEEKETVIISRLRNYAIAKKKLTEKKAKLDQWENSKVKATATQLD